MTETIKTAGQVMLEMALRVIVRAPDAGICSDDIGRHCLYCAWRDEDYEAEPRHEAQCPIEIARGLM